MANTKSKVSESLQDTYDTCYCDHKENVWRAISAKYKAQHIIDVCSSVPHSRILDIGAGDGAVADILAREGFGTKMSCLEISSSGVARIRERNIVAPVEVRQFDGYELDFPDDHFDLAYATHVLEHVEHERVFLKEAARVSRYLFIEVPLEDTYRLIPDYHPSSVGHINYYNYKTIRRLAQTTELIVLDQRLFDIPLEIHRFQSGAIGMAKYLIRRSAAVMPKLASRFFTYHCSLLCTRA